MYINEPTSLHLRSFSMQLLPTSSSSSSNNTLTDIVEALDRFEDNPTPQLALNIIRGLVETSQSLKQEVRRIPELEQELKGTKRRLDEAEQRNTEYHKRFRTIDFEKLEKNFEGNQLKSVVKADCIASFFTTLSSTPLVLVYPPLIILPLGIAFVPTIATLITNDKGTEGDFICNKVKVILEAEPQITVEAATSRAQEEWNQLCEERRREAALNPPSSDFSDLDFPLPDDFGTSNI